MNARSNQLPWLAPPHRSLAGAAHLFNAEIRKDFGAAHRCVIHLRAWDLALEQERIGHETRARHAVVDTTIVLLAKLPIKRRRQHRPVVLALDVAQLWCKVSDITSLHLALTTFAPAGNTLLRHERERAAVRIVTWYITSTHYAPACPGIETALARE